VKVDTRPSKPITRRQVLCNICPSNKIKKYDSDEESLIVGNRYILRSNEPNPFIIATFDRFHEYPKFRMAVYKELATGIEYQGGMIVIDFTHDLAELLTTMPPIEQWNYLAHNHCQLNEKYGIEYATHPCKCEACEVSAMA
jgi:hypothetical protein